VQILKNKINFIDKLQLQMDKMYSVVCSAASTWFELCGLILQAFKYFCSQSSVAIRFGWGGIFAAN